MKKALSLLLALILCLVLCACGGETQKPDNGNNDSSTSSSATHATEGEALVLYDEEYGYSFVNQARFSEIVEEIELTTENWADYIEVCSYTVETVEKDAFGEIISTNTSTHYVLGAKNNRYYHFRDFVIELKDKSTGELTIYEGNTPSVEEGFQLDQYACTRIKGTLYLIDVPEEVIQKAEGVGRYFTVRYSDEAPMDCFISGTDGYAVGQMIDWILY